MIEATFFFLLIGGIAVLLAGFVVQARTNAQFSTKMMYIGIAVAVVGVLGLGFFNPFPPPG